MISYRQFIWKLLRPHRKKLLFAGVLLLLLTSISILPPMIFAQIIDRVIGLGEYHLLTMLMLGMLLVPIISAGVRGVSEYLVARTGERFIFDLRLDLYRKVQTLSCRYLNNTTTGKLMERLRGDVNQLQALLTSNTLMMLVHATYGVLAIAVILWINVVIGLILIVAMVCFYLNNRWFKRRIRVVQKRYRRRMDLMSGRVQERLAGQVLVKSFGTERREGYDFLRHNFVTERVFHRFRMYNAMYGQTSMCIMTVTQLIVTLLGARLVIDEQMSFGQLLAVQTYAMQLLTPIVQVAELSNQVQQARVALDRIFEQMKAETDAIVRPGRKLQRITGDIRFEDVYFEYEPNNPVFTDLNLHVEPGMMVALVGQTGCGKSTITNLLYGFYFAQRGRILVDGVDIATLDMRWYRSHIATVPQEPIVFNTTLRENVAYGSHQHPTDAQIYEALRDAETQDLLERLPQGLDTILGEEGVRLSTGEKQRLCIARAILADPEILLLDEATSSLDQQSENLIQRALDRVMHSRTTFVIAHRLSTVIDADKIVVLGQGRVLEAGSHDELVRIEGGVYRNLYITQSKSMANAQDIEQMVGGGGS